MRGHLHIEAVCISVLGNTQPVRISEYVRRANAGGAGGDGLIQRFGLMVWPDVSNEWKHVDEFPDTKIRERVWKVFSRLAKLDAFALGAQMGPFDQLPFLRLDPAAQEDFLGWRHDLECRLRSGELSPAIEGHLAKYRKLVPALALVNHLADEQQGAISQELMLRALDARPARLRRFLRRRARYSAGEVDRNTRARRGVSRHAESHANHV